MKSKVFNVQIGETYTRGVFMKVYVPKDKEDEFNILLDEFYGGYKDYEELTDTLIDNGFGIINVDDNDSLFDFEENNYVEIIGVDNDD